MRSRIIKLSLGISFLSALCGCAAVGSALNPYEDDFKCSKKAPFGTCETTMEVYADLVAGPKTAAAAKGAPEPNNGVPAGYEIVESLGGLPAYSLVGTDTSAAGSRYVVAKKDNPGKEGGGFSSLFDWGSGPTAAKKREKPLESASVSPSTPTYAVRPKPETAYRDAALAKAAKLLRDPVTPVLIPPLAMRILYLPRRGEDADELNMAYFSFVIVDKAKFALGDYLTALPEE